jgi:hypothetical protein
MKWEELIAEARAAGVLAFCTDGIAVLKRCDGAQPEAEKNTGSSFALAGADRGQGRESRDRESQGAH